MTRESTPQATQDVLWFSAWYTREGNINKKAREQFILSSVQDHCRFYMGCFTHLSDKEKSSLPLFAEAEGSEGEAAAEPFGHGHTADSTQPGQNFSATSGSWLPQLSSLQSALMMAPGLSKVILSDTRRRMEGVFRVPPSMFFKDCKVVFWKRVGRCTYSLVCEEDENPVSVFHFLSLFPHMLTRIFSKVLTRECAFEPEQLLRRPEDIIGLLRKFLPSGQLLLISPTLMDELMRQHAKAIDLT